MDRAEFVFQIFFESINLGENAIPPFSLGFQIFSQQIYQIAPCESSRKYTGKVPISAGKRMNLKIPTVETLFDCPLSISLRVTSKGKTSKTIGQLTVSLQSVFKNSLQNSGKYIQKQFIQAVGKIHGEPIVVDFSVSICYTSSSQEAIEQATPALIRMESESLIETITERPVKKRDISTNTQSLYAPLPETRKRSIFSFDKAELMQESKQLENEIMALSDRIEQLKKYIDDHEKQSKTTSHKKSYKSSNDSRRSKTQTNVRY